MKPLQIEGIRALAENGSINFIGIRNDRRTLPMTSRHGKPVPDQRKARYTIEVNQIFFVANRAKARRYFCKMDSAMAWLAEVGISQVDRVLL